MTRFQITYTNDEIEEYDIDSVRFNDAGTVLYLRRAHYNGGVHENCKSIVLNGVRSWEWL